MKSISSAYYYEHPDYLRLFFKSSFPSHYFYSNFFNRKIRKYDYKSFVEILFQIIGYCIIAWLFLGLAKTTSILFYLLLFLICIFLIGSILIPINNFIFQKIDKKLKEESYVKWVKNLHLEYDSFTNVLAKNYSYFKNYKTTVGRTASLLLSALNQENINVMQESKVLWKGVKNVPKNPNSKWQNQERRFGWFKKFDYTADFVFVEKNKGIMIDIEIDEKHHFENPEQHKKDVLRNSIFLENGWNVIRITDKEIYSNVSNCVKDIKLFIDEVESLHQINREALKIFSMNCHFLYKFENEEIYRIIFKKLYPNKQHSENIYASNFDT